MAKRFISVQELAAAPEGSFKPSGTMGSHHLTWKKLENGALQVKGSQSGDFVAKSGDTIGYDCGQIWRVPSPSDFKDPIRRALAELKVSQKVLADSNEVVTISGYWQDAPEGSCADTFSGEEAETFGLVNKENRFGGSHDNFETDISGGVAVAVFSTVDLSTVARRPRRLTRLIVRPGANRKEVAEWLKSLEQFSR